MSQTNAYLRSLYAWSFYCSFTSDPRTISPFFLFVNVENKHCRPHPLLGLFTFFIAFVCLFMKHIHSKLLLFLVSEMRSYQYLILIWHSYYILYFEHYKYSHVYVFVCWCWCFTYDYTYSQDSILNDFGLFIPFCPLCLTLKLERMKWTKMNSKITWDSYFIQTSIYFFYSTERILIVFSACLCLEEERGMS